MLYSRIALALQEISQSPRSIKADKTAAIISEALREPQMLCPVVRLLTGELWPRWEGREMGIGPESIAAALGDVCDIDISAERKQKGDLGLVAEAALQHKGQNSLFGEPLDAFFVYESLRRISTFRGGDSEQRKISILRGLFLVATPLEGKFVARTALRSMQAGLGPRTMIAALSSALACDPQALGRAYGLMPDLGSIADLARRGTLDDVFIQEKLPTRFMIYPGGREVFPAAFLPKYPGLRVQVHKSKGEALVFTSQLREISSALSGLCRDVGQLEADFVADADLIGYFDSASGSSYASSMCSRREMHRYINRRHLARKSNIRPALLVYDLLDLDGKDICSMAYSDRRKMMISALGQPKALPFSVISPAPELILKDSGDVDGYLCQAEREGATGLLVRDLAGTYRPGEVAERDFIIHIAHTFSALAMAVEWTSSKKGDIRARYLVALRDGQGLVPVGWVWRASSACDCLPLAQAAKSLPRYGEELSCGMAPWILLKIKTRGAHRIGGDLRLIEPVIEGYNLNSSPEDADGLERLETICRE